MPFPWDAVGAQGVEEDGVVTPQFDVVEAGAVAQRVVGEVQDVVGLVVGEVELQQMEPLVDGLGQAELPHEQLDGADAAADDRPGLGGDIVVDVGGGEDWVGRRCGDRTVESAADVALAGGVVSVWNRSHSKSPRGWAMGSVCVDPMCRRHREISSFSLIKHAVPVSDHAWLILLCQLSQALLQLRLTSIGLSECDLLLRLSENAIQNDEGLCRILI